MGFPHQSPVGWLDLYQLVVRKLQVFFADCLLSKLSTGPPKDVKKNAILGGGLVLGKAQCKLNQEKIL